MAPSPFLAKDSIIPLSSNSVSRRRLLATALGATACGFLPRFATADDAPPAKLKGRIKQAITPGTLKKMSVEQMCQ